LSDLYHSVESGRPRSRGPGRERQSKYQPVKATQWEIGRTYLQARGTENNRSCLHFLLPQPPAGPRSPDFSYRRKWTRRWYTSCLHF